MPWDVVALQTAVGSTTAVNPARPYRAYSNITLPRDDGEQPVPGAAHGVPLEAATPDTSLTLNYTLSRNQTDSTNDRDTIDVPQNPRDPGRGLRRRPDRSAPHLHGVVRLRAPVLPELEQRGR